MTFYPIPSLLKNMMSAGLPSTTKTEDEDFHQQMEVEYALQRRAKTNNNVVKARLPRYMLSEFTKFRLNKGWDESTAIRFALHKLLKSSN